MSEEKKPISKSSTVTIGLLILVVSCAIFVGTTIQKVSANEDDIKSMQEVMRTLVTKDDFVEFKTDIKTILQK